VDIVPVGDLVATLGALTTWGVVQSQSLGAAPATGTLSTARIAHPDSPDERPGYFKKPS
jgi:hypothetical protein